ncbi:Uncharacterised protein [Serratia fonticola]|uniref:Adhesin n=2 Tax=Serratia fonticola TaxID=47917 RepID=A0A4U9WIX8_SERFO|nr:Uncharacterised protein [Serratia fonticola]CAI1629706.1 Uncharacterised protein [Serratia fonticola]VTR58932.1 Uncharacterised protein [Serratia fonticola]
MKKTTNTPGHASYHRRLALCILLLASQSQPAALAETITIGKGTGIVWEGLPFNATLTGRIGGSNVTPTQALVAITSNIYMCQTTAQLSSIAGYQAVKLAPGVGLLPRASASGNYTSEQDILYSISSTLGLPETKGVRTSPYGSSAMYLPPDRNWCLSPSNADFGLFFSPDVPRKATISGSWVLVADGNQKAAEITVPIMYAASFGATSSGNRTAAILPSNLKLRISTLECTVNTPTSIAFGGVMKKTQVGAELAVQSYPLITNCGQSSDFIDANINLQFRALSGLYKSAPTRLALRQGGGYITGEIDNGVTGSGNCATTSGLPFDNRQLKIGRINQAETSLSITNQVTWRLCSGGKDLPLGNVSAAAEMLVTFN